MSRMRILVAALVAMCLFGAAMAELRGATPEFEKSVSSSSKITCDGGKKTIKKEYINDDYCDCEDGTDEPGTSACANAKFYCKNTPHLPLTIPSQWVDDGHCDCCDGSDEQSGKCPNTCAAAAAQHNKALAEQREKVEAGLRVRTRYVESAKKAKASKRVRLQELESNILPKAEEHLKQLEAQKERIDNEFKVLQDQVDSVKAAQEEENKQQEQEQVDGAQPEHTETESKPEQAQANPEDDPAYKEAKEKREKIDSEVSDARRVRDDAKREVEEINKFLALDFGPDDAFHGIYGETFEFSTHEYTYELKPYQSVNQRSSGRTTKMGDWEGWKGSDFSVQMYTRGEHCWGGPDRSAKVHIKCGTENRLFDVKEPAKCEYELTFQTPAACDPNRLS